MNYQMNRCIIRESEKIRDLLNNQIDKMGLSSRAVVINARKEGRTFTEQTLSRFRKHGNVLGTLSTDDIMWLCDKYKVKLTLKVKKTR